MHIVGLKYKPAVTQDQKDEVMKEFLVLKKECKRDGETYIVSLVDGDCTGSLERLTSGFEHAFIVTFNSADDYKYYLGAPFSNPFDLAHDEFKKLAVPLLSVDDDGEPMEPSCLILRPHNYGHCQESLLPYRLAVLIRECPAFLEAPYDHDATHVR
jgi:Stress responsive A/B Barrel Domain